jgi:hypothetical protein
MAKQLSEVCTELSDQLITPLDAENGCAPFLEEISGISCDFNIRLRPNICLRKVPGRHRGRGRPALHGKFFRWSDSRTRGKPTATRETRGENGERIHLRLWKSLPFRKAARHSFSVLRIEFPDRPGTRRRPREIWLAWIGQELPALEDWWDYYFRRSTMEHWYRFAEQSLGWTVPQFRIPEQEERWSDLTPIATWELFLSRKAVRDHPLPWQKDQTILSPGRVKQSLGALWARIGLPANGPEPRGKGPGWIKGRPRIHRSRVPIVRKCRTQRNFIEFHQVFPQMIFSAASIMEKLA